MASLAERLPTNVEGDIYVDRSCIDCGTCRWMAPEVFDRAKGLSRVHHQPDSSANRLRALQALVACPTASIGSVSKVGIREAATGFPVRVLPGVLHCGFHDEASFGAAPWFIERPEGNVLVDVPRFSAPLAHHLEGLGGVRWLFLTHRDDVAEHQRWADRFGCERVLHVRDQTASTRGVERLIDGADAITLAPDLVVIPTPGHTAGSACLLWQDRVLFSGDHLAWSLNKRQLTAFRRACWFDWETQIASMERLQAWSFEAVLPGHGAPILSNRSDLATSLAACVAWMRTIV